MKDWYIRIGMLVIIVLLALHLFFPIQSVKSAQKYKYKILDMYPSVNADKLNAASNDGWEYVGTYGGTVLILRK